MRTHACVCTCVCARVCAHSRVRPRAPACLQRALGCEPEGTAGVRRASPECVHGPWAVRAPGLCSAYCWRPSCRGSSPRTGNNAPAGLPSSSLALSLQPRAQPHSVRSWRLWAVPGPLDPSGLWGSWLPPSLAARGPFGPATTWRGRHLTYILPSHVLMRAEGSVRAQIYGLRFTSFSSSGERPKPRENLEQRGAQRAAPGHLTLNSSPAPGPWGPTHGQLWHLFYHLLFQWEALLVPSDFQKRAEELGISPNLGN